jgi:ribosomal protein S18 acetylase RimI-like enzyme
MDPPERVEEFRGFLARGDVGYYAYLGGRVVHRTWVRRGPVRGPLWLAWGSLEVGPSQAYVHYCETAPAARGHGIYPAVIAHAAREARDAGARDVLISSRVDNVASLRGIARAGFDERERHVLRIRFGRCVQSRVIGPSPARPAPQ